MKTRLDTANRSRVSISVNKLARAGCVVDCKPVKIFLSSGLTLNTVQMLVVVCHTVWAHVGMDDSAWTTETLPWYSPRNRGKDHVLIF